MWRQVAFVLLSSSHCLPILAQVPQLESEYLSIEDHIAAGDQDGALAMISSALERTSGDAGLLNLRGIVRAQRNSLKEARHDFEEAVKHSPQLVPAWRNLARACEASNDPACALNAWRTVSRLQPSDGEALYELALGYAASNRFAVSLRTIDQISPKLRTEAGVILLRCADLAKLGRVAEASQVASDLNKAGTWTASDWAKTAALFRSDNTATLSVELLQGLSARKAADLPALQDLAFAYEQSKRPDDARRVLEQVAAQDPINPAHLFELARLSDQEGHYEESLGYLAHARDLQPKEAPVHFLMAKVEMELNLVAEARHSLQEALQLDPENPAYNYAMGFVLLSTRDAASASTSFQKFVAKRPADLKGHYALGVALYASGDYRAAKRELSMSSAGAKTAGGANYFLGCIARRENEPEAAAAFLHRSIEQLPDYSESHTELARLLLAQKDFAGAQTQLLRALALNRDSFGANEQLLVLYKRTHDERATAQEDVVKRLNGARSERADLMFRSVQFKP